MSGDVALEYIGEHLPVHMNVIPTTRLGRRGAIGQLRNRQDVPGLRCTMLLRRYALDPSSCTEVQR